LFAFMYIKYPLVYKEIVANYTEAVRNAIAVAGDPKSTQAKQGEVPCRACRSRKGFLR
jgi:hypothetical protein